MNDKGRLAKEEIDRMVADAEKYKKEDETQRDRIAAKNSLESYCFNMKTSINDDKMQQKSSYCPFNPYNIYYYTET